jgi:Tfp pilus assembly protein PilZ
MPSERRSSGLLRVPFVQVCRLTFADDRVLPGFVVNVNILGAYVSAESGQFPALGERVVCTFRTPDNHIDMSIPGSVAWVNTYQAHLVHSLPPGFGIKFENLSDEHRRRIERIVADYVARHPQAR